MHAQRSRKTCAAGAVLCDQRAPRLGAVAGRLPGSGVRPHRDRPPEGGCRLRPAPPESFSMGGDREITGDILRAHQEFLAARPSHLQDTRGSDGLAGEGVTSGALDMRFNLTDARKKLPKLIKAVARGELGTICRRGAPTPPLVPTTPPTPNNPNFS